MLNMLIFVAEPVNHEVKNKPTIFNIIYIIRTKIRAINFWALMALGWVLFIVTPYTPVRP